MDSQTWKTTLTADIDAAALQSMRLFLRNNLAIVPSRHDDLIAKYFRLVIESNSVWDDAHAPVSFSRPRVVPMPWQGIENEVRHAATEPMPGFLRYLKRLAIGSCGLLLMLACVVAFTS